VGLPVQQAMVGLAGRRATAEVVGTGEARVRVEPVGLAGQAQQEAQERRERARPLTVRAAMAWQTLAAPE
jgi:hypothetical protein